MFLAATTAKRRWLARTSCYPNLNGPAHNQIHNIHSHSSLPTPTPLTSLPHTQVKPAEMQEVVSAYKDKGDANGVKKVQSTGLHVGGDRFIVIKADDRSVYGKKVRFHPIRL